MRPSDKVALPTIFVSYSHEDGRWLRRISTHLEHFQRQGLLEIWDDSHISVGADWEAEIQVAIERARVAVLLVTANFLSSDFVLEKEVPRLLERRRDEGMHLIPIIVEPCYWKKINWLKEIQFYPLNGQALSELKRYKQDRTLAQLAEEIDGLLTQELTTAQSPKNLAPEAQSAEEKVEPTTQDRLTSHREAVVDQSYLSTSTDPRGQLERLNPEELDFFMGISRRAFQAVISSSPIYLKSKPSLPNAKNNLYVASLSYKIPDPSKFARETVTPDGRFDIITMTPGAWADLLNCSRDFIAESTRRNLAPEFLVLNELAHAFQDADALAEEWKTLAKHTETYILPGTFYDIDSLYAVAPIYGPRSSPVFYRLKQISDFRAGENTRIPNHRTLHVLETNRTRVIPLTLAELCDPAIILKLMNLLLRRQSDAKRHRDVALVLVSAYTANSRENIEQLLIHSSQLSKSVIICSNTSVNSWTEASRLENYGYCAGKPLEVVLEKDYYSPDGGGLLCRASLYRIDIRELQIIRDNSSSGSSSAFSSIISGSPFLRSVED